jgi:small subunit ribosomal protein S13
VARIAGTDLPRDKRIDIALTYIFGIGHTRARQALLATGLEPSTRVVQLSEDAVRRLRDHIDGNYQVEGDLRREVAQNIKRKVENGSYQGVRHRRSLPVRGQRTHTNARTRKGPRRAIGGTKRQTRK